MNPVLVAHGTRKGSGVAMIGELADQVSGLLDRRVHTAFVDVLGPTPAEVLSALPPGPAVVVPAFLSSGYHVHNDIPAGIAESGHRDVTVTPALGPSFCTNSGKCTWKSRLVWKSSSRPNIFWRERM